MPEIMPNEIKETIRKVPIAGDLIKRAEVYSNDPERFHKHNAEDFMYAFTDVRNDNVPVDDIWYERIGRHANFLDRTTRPIPGLNFIAGQIMSKLYKSNRNSKEKEQLQNHQEQ